ncbi:ribonuclease H-like domain, reverse transcriptase, RNA-dependent DNA polymerase [Tanacetum coccineum]
MTRRVLLRCDSTGDLYPVTAPSLIPHVFIVSQHTWHQRLGHPGREVLRHLVSNNFISFNKEKHPMLFHACQLGKHVRLPFVSSNTVVTSCFDIIHSDVWTSPIPNLMAEGLTARMLMEHRDEAGVSVFTSRAWRRMFDIRGPLVHELILEFFSTFSARQIPDKGYLRDYWMGISSIGDFLGTTPSYTAIRDPILRLCHRLIACSIAGRSQAPEKVTVTDLFYLRGMDIDSVNVPYLLARYLRLFAVGRKSGAHISGGQFVARLAEHFGLLTVEILGGLTTWAWVSIRPERQPDAAAGPPTDDEDAPIVDEGGQADPTLVTLVAASATTRSCQDYTPKLMEASGQPYQAFDGTFRGSSPGTFHRRKASTSIA